MIIHPPTIKEQDNILTVSAAIEVERNPLLSTTIWYKFPAAQREFVSDRSDSFLVGLVFLAMKLGEDITVEGVVSPRVVQELKELQQYFSTWAPSRFQTVFIRCRQPLEDSGEKSAIVSSFSGGIDSWYTLVKHTQDLAKHDQITHALFVSGFDMPLRDEHTAEVKTYYQKLLATAGITLLTADTNLKEYLDLHVEQNRTFGAVLASVFLALNKNTARVYLASSFQYHDLLPGPKAAAIADGSNPISDPLFSTETTTFFHHDAAISRVQKTLALADYPLTYNNLRVCWKPQGLINCCQCSKCLRTMLTLKLGGVLSHYSRSFPVPFSRKLIQFWTVEGKDRGFVTEIKGYARSLGRSDIVWQMRRTLWRPWIYKYTPLETCYRLSAAGKKYFPPYRAFVRMVKQSFNMYYDAD